MFRSVGHAVCKTRAVTVGGQVHPLRLTGRYEPQPSRWLWLVKPVLVLPHVLVLAVMWAIVVCVTVVALCSILATRRYPRSLFDFVVGVLRWSWRVGFYSLSMSSTDRYPPFSLGPDSGYPADLELAYPERLSRRSVLVKLLLALPHLIVIGVLEGGFDEGLGPGLTTALVVIALLALLFLGRYPRGLFDLLMGCNRWIVRVLVYILLLTDHYPPFRLDQGEDEPVAA